MNPDKLKVSSGTVDGVIYLRDRYSELEKRMQELKDNNYREDAYQAEVGVEGAF